MNSWIPWAIVAASVIHIVEEYFGGWLVWVQRYAKGVTQNQFFIVNSFFLAICIGAAASSSITLKLSLASLLFVNAMIHIFPTVILKHYSPGLLSAVILYLPISIFAYVSVLQSRVINLCQIIVASLMGVLFMVIPILFQYLRIRCVNKNPDKL